MYICTYHVHLIWTLMSGKHKYEKDKSNGDLLWHLCPEKFWIFQTVLIDEMSYIWAAHCSYQIRPENSAVSNYRNGRKIPERYTMNAIAVYTQGCSDAMVEYLLHNLKVKGSCPACAQIFSVTPLENSGGAEISTENSGPHAIIFFVICTNRVSGTWSG